MCLRRRISDRVRADSRRCSCTSCERRARSRTERIAGKPDRFSNPAASSSGRGIPAHGLVTGIPALKNRSSWTPRRPDHARRRVHPQTRAAPANAGAARTRLRERPARRSVRRKRSSLPDRTWSVSPACTADPACCLKCGRWRRSPCRSRRLAPGWRVHCLRSNSLHCR